MLFGFASSARLAARSPGFLLREARYAVPRGRHLPASSRRQQHSTVTPARASVASASMITSEGCNGGRCGTRRWGASALVASLVGATVVAGAGSGALSESFSPARKQESEFMELVQNLVNSDTLKALITTESLLSEESPVSGDHFFTHLLKNEMVTDMHCFFDPEQRKFHSLVGLGSDVCGHPTIVHGGLTAAIMDEAFGGLIFCLKKWKILGPGPPFTVKLEVNYLKPLHIDTTVICSIELEQVEGRKVWMKASVADTKTSDVYASGRALFVTPKLKVARMGYVCQLEAVA